MATTKSFTFVWHNVLFKYTLYLCSLSRFEVSSETLLKPGNPPPSPLVSPSLQSLSFHRRSIIEVQWKLPAPSYIGDPLPPHILLETVAYIRGVGGTIVFLPPSPPSHIAYTRGEGGPIVFVPPSPPSHIAYTGKGGTIVFLSPLDFLDWFSNEQLKKVSYETNDIFDGAK